MSASLGKSKSNASNQTAFDQDVWGPQGDALTRMYGQVGNLADRQFGSGGKGGGGKNRSATNTLDQGIKDQMAGGAYKDMDLQSNLMGSLNSSLNQPTATQEINNMIMGGSGNNYADAMKDQYTQDATRAQENMMANMDARAAASGMSGGSRHGTAIGRGMEDINRNLQANMATTGFNTFDKDLDRKLAIASQADQGTLARQQMMQQMLGGQQGAMQGGVNTGMGYQDQQLMAPWKQASAYSGVLGGPTVLSSGSSSGSSSSKGAGGSAGGKK